MTHVLMQAVLWMDSGLPEDYAVNTWHINTTAVDPTAGTAAFQSDLTTFYTTIDGYLGAALEGTIAFRAYNMSDPEPRFPFVVDGMAATPGSGTLPHEVALCLSFQGARISGENQARRRGRVYIGPLASGAADSTGRPAGAFISALAGAGDVLATDALADASYSWCVYSPTADNLTVITNGWVDNAFDTQRRRGVAPTGRTVFVT